jgi:maltose alpha-D-glucosyltransferase/alpha-amylase
MLGDRAIMKFIRRFEEGINPGVEVGRFLSERARFRYAPLSGGSVEYRPDAAGSVPTTVAVLEEFISNEDDGWNYVVDALTHSLEEALAHRQDAELRLAPPATSSRYTGASSNRATFSSGRIWSGPPFSVVAPPISTRP